MLLYHFFYYVVKSNEHLVYDYEEMKQNMIEGQISKPKKMLTYRYHANTLSELCLYLHTKLF